MQACLVFADRNPRGSSELDKLLIELGNYLVCYVLPSICMIGTNIPWTEANLKAENLKLLWYGIV